MPKEYFNIWKEIFTVAAPSLNLQAARKRIDGMNRVL
jgi:hypothetical protein